MFLTTAHGRTDHSGVFEPHFSAWRYVEHTLHRPWFYVATTDLEGQRNVQSMIMACSEITLSGMLTHHPTSVRVDKVMLVSPGHVNQRACWQMEELESVRRYTSSRGCAFLYRLHDGQTYCYGHENIAGEAAANVDELYSAFMSTWCTL